MSNHHETFYKKTSLIGLGAQSGGWQIRLKPGWGQPVSLGKAVDQVKGLLIHRYPPFLHPHLRSLAKAVLWSIVDSLNLLKSNEEENQLLKNNHYKNFKNTLIIFYKERLKTLYSQGILNFD